MAIILNSGSFLQTARFGASQDVTIGGTSTQGAVIGTSGQTPNRLVRLSATAICRVAFGTNPTATLTSALIQPNMFEYVELIPGERIAVIGEAGSSGKLNITECVL